MADTMLAQVKTALRITHSSLDTAITEDIAAAKAELERAGIPQSIATDTTLPLIAKAIKTYCLASYANDTTAADKYQAAFKSQLDNLRKSSAYNTEVPPNGE